MDGDVTINGFDIHQDNMIIYLNNKDLDVFPGVSTMEDGQWKSNQFQRDTFEGISIWKFSGDNLILVTQMNTTLIYNFEERKLIHKITNPQKLLDAGPPPVKPMGMSRAATMKKQRTLNMSGKSPKKSSAVIDKIEIPS
jgi:hypothetical protein